MSQSQASLYRYALTPARKHNLTFTLLRYSFGRILSRDTLNFCIQGLHISVQGLWPLGGSKAKLFSPVQGLLV